MSGAPKVVLTAEQRELARTVPGLAEQAVHQVLSEWGHLQDRDTLLADAHYGIALAAQSYKPDRGSTFEQWAFFRAVHTIIDSARKERPHRRLDRALRASLLRVMADGTVPADQRFDATDEDIQRDLDAFGDEVVLAALEAGARDAEDTAAENEAWLVARDALARVVSGLDDAQRELLERVFSHGYHIKQIARLQDVDYWTLLYRYRKLIELMRARLAGLGIRGLPPPVDTPQGWGVLDSSQKG